MGEQGLAPLRGSQQERFAIGDHVVTGMQGGTIGVVEKVGRKWVTVRWTQPHGATWTKQHLPEWLSPVPSEEQP